MIIGKQSVSTLMNQTQTESKDVIQPFQRVAIHLTGQVRNTLTNVKQQVFKSLSSKGYDVHLYAFVDDSSLLTELSDICTIKIIITDNDYTDIHRLRSNSLKMFYRMKVLQSLVHEDYDIVIRLRPDVVFLYPLELQHVNQLVCIPRLSLPIRNTPKDMTDIFFYGNQEVMRKIHNIFDPYQESKCCNPEVFLKNYINYHGIEYVFDCKTILTLKDTTLEHYSLNLIKHLKTLSIVIKSNHCDYNG